MCIRISGTFAFAATSARRGSFRSAVTSFKISAPAASAARATADLLVSTEIGIRISRRRPSITGRIRCSSSSTEIAADPGRVDSPPTSMMSAPAASIAMPRATAASRSRKLPPSEKLSGVTFSTPITSVARARAQSCETEFAAGMFSAYARRLLKHDSRHLPKSGASFRYRHEVGRSVHDSWVAVADHFDAQLMPTRLGHSAARGGRETQRVLRANLQRDLLEGVGKRVGFANKIKLAAGTPHEFGEVQRVG